ncbi:MAG: insulinase family protein, partial [Nitrospira sp.]
QQAPPTEQELQRAQNQVEATHIFGQDSNFRQAMLMGQAETTGAGWKQIELFVKKLRDVKTEDVQRVAKKYLVEDTQTVGILIPTPMSRMAEAN